MRRRQGTARARPAAVRGALAAALAGASLLAGAALLATPVAADSEMHQSPLLERGSPEACATSREDGRQRGQYPWRFSCPDDDGTPGSGRARDRAR